MKHKTKQIVIMTSNNGWGKRKQKINKKTRTQNSFKINEKSIQCNKKTKFQILNYNNELTIKHCKLKSFQINSQNKTKKK